MKIATITCHDVYNYGASLQAYALQQFCISSGHDYQIIDYKPSYLSGHFNLAAVSNPKYDLPIVKQLYLLAKLPGRLRALPKKQLFDQFTLKYLKLSENKYASNEELKNNCPQADLYIAGSDQIWNTLFQNGIDPAFYLDFVPADKRKISYAASFATEEIAPEYKLFVESQVSRIDAVSVREQSAIDILQDLHIKNATLVCDPVFLLTQLQWASLIPKSDEASKPYILVYDCEGSSLVRSIAEELRRKTEMPIYAVSSIYGKYANKLFENSGPLEFLRLIANAEYVVANSFHALAFSIIFKKNFFIVNRSEKINTRMRDFLRYLSLDNRLISNPKELNTSDIDYSKCEHKLCSLIQESKNYLTIQFNFAT